MSRASLLLLSFTLGCSGAQRPAPAAQPVCGQPDTWRSAALARAEGAVKAALERWQPGQPVVAVDRPAVLEVAREHLKICGLEETVALTTRLIAFQTVSAHRDAGAGPQFEQMGAFLKAWAEQRGMSFHSVGDNDVWELSWGTGPAGVGFLLHGDVVPASSLPDPALANSKESRDRKGSSLPPGWTHAPFAAERVGDRLYGRGSEDDKGPIAAVLVAMDTLRRFDLPPTRRMVTIIGNGEESNWEPMKAYATQTQPPKFTVSVDANFPLVIAEAGFVAWHLTAPAQSGKAIRCAQVTEARGGELLAQVPGDAQVKLRAGAAEGADALFVRAQQLAAEEAATRGAPFRVEVSRERDQVVLKTFGQAAHSAIPEQGANALWPMARLVSRLGVCEGGAGSLLRLIAEGFDGDHLGTRLGLGYADPVQGPLVQAPTLLRLEKGVATLGVNLRRPGGMTKADFSRRLDEVTARLGRSHGVLEDRTLRSVGEPHLADLHGPLVPTLLGIYRRESGDPTAKPIAIRGGTYARLFPGAVSFGPALPGRPYVGHAPDEYIELSTLSFQLRVLLEAAVQLDGLAAKAAK
ncbi:MAG: Sapep family Mn(2+)-dependent dipeptidase [Myxococcota bacterium]|nr:Sapep family Mn(2+)-dependent dipeptidase [Myxococcota bacterium]